MPANHPPSLYQPSTEEYGQRPQKSPLTRRKWWLIGLLVALLMAGATTVGLMVPGHPRKTGVEVAQPAQSSPAPQTTSAAVSPSVSPSASLSPSRSASASASHPANANVKENDPRHLGGPNCAPQPSRCGFPDGTNTGVPAGSHLTVLNGDQKIRRAGTVIDGKDIRGCVDIEAPRVTIRRSKIACAGFYVVGSFAERYKGGGALLQDVEISCLDSNGTGVGSYGLTAVRVNIHSCENGFDIDNTVTVRDSYIHRPHNTAENHADGIQLNAGSKIVISHNTIFAPKGTSAIISHPTGNSDVLVSHNLLGGGAYTLYCPRDTSTGYRVIDNRFSTLDSPKGGEYGPWTDCAKAAVVTGNVWDATLKALHAD